MKKSSQNLTPDYFLCEKNDSKPADQASGYAGL